MKWVSCVSTIKERFHADVIRYLNNEAFKRIKFRYKEDQLSIFFKIPRSSRQINGTRCSSLKKLILDLITFDYRLEKHTISTKIKEMDSDAEAELFDLVKFVANLIVDIRKSCSNQVSEAEKELLARCHKNTSTLYIDLCNLNSFAKESKLFYDTLDPESLILSPYPYPHDIKKDTSCFCI